MPLLIRTILIAMLISGLILAPASAEPPRVFTDLTYEEAREAAVERDKLLIVMGTAEWCGPCQRMKRTTWVDDDVVAWINQHAIAILLDVDDQRQTARALRIRGMPTTIAFKQGEEFDRIVGFRSAGELLDWLEGVQRGKRAADALVRAIREGEAGPPERLDLARQLLQAGDYEEATTQYLWLWENIPDQEPALIGVRASFMLSNVEQLMSEHEPARREFTRIRDDIEETLKTDRRTWQDLQDWVALNNALGEQEKTLEWFDRIKDEPGGMTTAARVSTRLIPLLLARDRWADAGRLYRNPVRESREYIARISMMAMFSEADDPEQAARLEESMERSARRNISTIYAATLAAQRDDAADAVATILLEALDDAESRMLLVQRALDAGQARPEHLDMLDDALEQGGDADDIAMLRARAAEQLEAARP